MDNTLTYVYRYIAWNLPDITDYRRFPSLPVLNNPDDILPLPVGAPLAVNDVPVIYQQNTTPQPFDVFLQQSGTTSFLVVHRGQIVYEKYSNGYSADSIVTSFSLSESLTSALVGVALDEGILPDLDSPVLAQLPELTNRISPELTLRHLLCMTSGLQYQEGQSPWSDESRIYYGPDLRKQLLRCESIEPPGRHYHYNAYNMLLLGRLLEKAAGMSVPAYFSQKIWSRLGAERPAFWSTDSRTSAFAKMESGFNATARDFARFGLLYLNKGRFGAKQVIPEAWVYQSTRQPTFDEYADPVRYMSRQHPPLNQWVSGPVGYYKYLWWGYRNNPHLEPDYFAMGKLGQFLYCSPLHETVIVRFGKKNGNIDWWPLLFRELTSRLT